MGPDDGTQGAHVVRPVPFVGAPDPAPPQGAAPPLTMPSFASRRDATPLPGVQRDMGPDTATETGDVQARETRDPVAPKDAPENAQPAAPQPAPKPAPDAPKKKKGPPKAKHVVQPVAPAARMRRRHWGLLLSLGFLVIAPLVVVAWYLWMQAEDQYASLVGFTVNSEEGGAATDLIGGVLGNIGGGGGQQKNTDILYEFIQSQDLVNRIQERFDIRAAYSEHHGTDPFFSINPDASAEDLLSYWERVISVSYDQSSGLIEMRVQSFDPQLAQDIATAILEESQQLINTMNKQAREDTIQYARVDLEDALERLKSSREALTLFRTRTQIVDPQSDLEGRLGVVANLQQQLAQALIEQDLLLEQTSADDPRLVQARRKIDVIRLRIDQERENVSSGGASSAGDDSYPRLLAEYEGLQVDQEFAEQSYRAALTAVDIARTNASRQTRYLVPYITPTYPQTAQYPRRALTMGLATLFLMLFWSIIALVYYSIRDSK